MPLDGWEKCRRTEPTSVPLRSVDVRGWLAALLVTGLVWGCDDGGDGAVEAEVEVRDSAGVVIEEFAAELLDRPSPMELAGEPDVRIGVVMGATEYQWARPVAGARFSDGTFVILEQAPAEVRLFDPDGRFLRRVGREGDGPGELRVPAELAVVPGDTMVIWDRRARRLSWFDRHGTLARERTLQEPGGIQRIRKVVLPPSGGVIALGAGTTETELANQGRVRERWQIVAVEPDGAGTDRVLGEIPGVERSIQVQSAGGRVLSVNVQGRWWWGDAFAWASERGAWTVDRLVLEARHFHPERGLERIVRILAPDRPFTEALIDSLHQVELERMTEPERVERWRAGLEEREYPAGVPPVAGVFADAVPRLWIGLTEPPPERLPSGQLSAIRRWVLFEGGSEADTTEETGLRGLGVVTLPPRSHPLWADEEGVLLVRNDPKLDVAYVEWYPWVEREPS